MHSKTTFHWILIGFFILGSVGSLPAQNHVYVKAAPSGPQVTTTSDAWTDIPDLVLSFEQVLSGYVNIAFSAEAYTGGSERMFARALINGVPASPSDVLLVTGTFRGVCTFCFVSSLDPGVFEVKMQWKVDTGGTAYLGDRAMVVTSAPFYMVATAAPSGPDVSTASSILSGIPDLLFDVSFTAPGYGVLAVTGEAEASNNARMFVAGSANSQAMKPSDVVFAIGAYASTHAFTFVQEQAPSGAQSFLALWWVDSGGTAFMGDRTATLAYVPSGALSGDFGGFRSISAPSGDFVTTTSTDFIDIPDLNTVIEVPQNASLAVSLTAEAFTSAGKRMFVRALVGDQPLWPSDVVFATETWYGTTRFDFVIENWPAGPFPVRVQWKVDAGGTGFLGDRNMTITGFSAPTTGVDGGRNRFLPETMALEQNYPNPFNGTTVIGYHVPEPGKVSLKVFNSRGREVQTLVNEQKPAGRYQAVFHGEGLPTGIYVCRLIAGSRTVSRKMLLIR